MKGSLTLAQARRVALAAQGFSGPDRRTGEAGGRLVENTVRAMGLLQLDSVNVLVRSHYLPIFSRAGPYRQEHLDRRAFGSNERRFFEYWAHEASLLPLELHPLMRWRMQRAAAGQSGYRSLHEFAKSEQPYVAAVLREVQDRGPLGVSELTDPGGRTGQWWGWSKGKYALEYLFAIGAITTAARRGFERIYDLPERVIPPAILNLPTVHEPDAIRTLLDLSGSALGIATATDLRDYFRLPVEATKAGIVELVEAGRLVPVAVEGWKPQAYLHVEAKLPRKAGGRALISPFDPLVWERERAERLFGFRYRIEIYTPAPKRTFGYYVLPFLLGDRFAARACLKADRAAGVLRVNAAHGESHADPGETARALASELRLLARWLELERVEAASAGGLAEPLRQALGRE